MRWLAAVRNLLSIQLLVYRGACSEMYKLRMKIASTAAIEAIGGAIWFSMQARAQDQPTGAFLAFGMVGLSTGQSARLNVVTVGVPSDMAIELTFLDSTLEVVADVAGRTSVAWALRLERRQTRKSSNFRGP